MGEAVDGDSEQGKLVYTFEELCELGDEEWASEAETELEYLNWYFDTEIQSLWISFYVCAHEKYLHITNYLELTVLLAKVFIAYKACYQDRDKKDALQGVAKGAKTLLNKIEKTNDPKVKDKRGIEFLQRIAVDEQQPITQKNSQKKLSKKRADYMVASMYIIEKFWHDRWKQKFSEGFHCADSIQTPINPASEFSCELIEFVEAFYFHVHGIEPIPKDKIGAKVRHAMNKKTKPQKRQRKRSQNKK